MIFVVVNKRTRRTAEQRLAQEAEAYRRKQEKPKAEKTPAQVQAMLNQARADAPQCHPLDLARPGSTPIAFANLVLTTERRLERIGGHDFIDSRPATPQARLTEANRILKRLGLEQIGGDLWRV